MKIVLSLVLIMSSGAWAAEGKKKLAPRAEVILSDDNKHIDGKTPDEKMPEQNPGTNTTVSPEKRQKKDAKQ